MLVVGMVGVEFFFVCVCVCVKWEGEGYRLHSYDLRPKLRMSV